MKTYARIRQAVAETPWAITPGKLALILEVLDLHARGVTFTADEVRERIGAAPVGRPREAGRVRGGVAVLPVYGVISQRMGLLTETSGGTSTEQIAQMFRQAMGDDSVGAIVLDVDSPGGSVYGVAELADEVYRARGGKPIVAVANSIAASAAYWIATAADELAATPGGEVGSIGVLAAHTETSAMDAAMGVKTTLIGAGKYKSEGNPYEPLTDEARAAIQGRVDTYYSMFVDAVARHRGVTARDVRSGFGEGRVVGAAEARTLGMIDRIATLEETISRLAGRSRAPNSARADGQGGVDMDLRRRRLRLHEALPA